MSDPRADRDAYLDRVAARLRLPEADAEDVIEELRGHLAESVASLLDEGLTADQAERESIARLGDPGELADGIRTARQTRRRLLAAAGSGAVAAVGGVVWGYLFAAVLATAAGVLTTLILSLALQWLHLSTPGYRMATDLLSIPFALFIPGYAAHRMVGAIADRSARPVSTIRRPIALVGGGLLAVAAIFMVPFDDGLIGLLVLLAIPVGFAAGAMLARDESALRLRRLSGRWVLALIGVATLTLTVASLATSKFNPAGGYSVDYTLEQLGPPATDVLGDGWLDQQSSISLGYLSGVTLSPEPPDLLDGWRDLRLEAWPASDEIPFDIDPSATAPALIAPITRDAIGLYVGTFDLGTSKVSREYLVTTTGIAPNGTRYLLGGPSGPVAPRPWTGTVWEYLTTP